MPSIKADAEAKERSPLNTTINKIVFTNFKKKCKEIGMPMSMVLEIFMSQFAKNEFELKVHRRYPEGGGDGEIIER